MPLSNGTKLGPYEILSPAGAGGMGEVYRARDTRLEREVAVKILPAHLSTSPDLRARFEREARAISSLQHPHICTLFDVGHQDGTDFLVMEFLEGETLAERLKRGPLPLEQLLKTGTEIADALDRAHRQGIIHRDLKPGNVMLTKGGAKLMDFGLAKGLAAAGAAAGSGALPPTFTAARTMSSPVSPLTAAGTVVGTFQYMSPEQVEGKESDARSDIFAFGALLYEMATGKRAFEGKSQLSIASAVLEKDPEPISALAPMTPPALEHVVRTCLAKEPDERWQSAADVARQLRWIADSGSQVGVPKVVSSRRRLQQRAFWAVAPVLILLAALGGYFAPRTQPPPLPTLHASLPPPKGAAYVSQPNFALSPDAGKLAFVARKSGGELGLFVRQMATGTVQEIAGTTGAFYPFWSPDSRYVGFFSQGKLRKVDTVGGAITALADAEDGRGGAWSPRGVIVFAHEANGHLMQVADTGGTPTQLTTRAEDDLSHRWPIFLPDGETVLFFAAAAGTSGAPSADPATTAGIYSITLAGGAHRKLLTTDSNAKYDPAGYLLYVHQGNLMAHPFDAAKLQFRGSAVPVAQQVRYHAIRWLGGFSISSTGVMALSHEEGGVQAELLWYDVATGKPLGRLGGPGDVFAPRFSPDGRRVVVSTVEPNGTFDLWTLDVERGARSRLTFEGSARAHVWTPDGRHVTFTQTAAPKFMVKHRAASGLGSAEELFSQNSGLFPSAWSPDGKSLVYMNFAGGRGPRLWLYDPAGKAGRPLLGTNFAESDAAISPDGKWMAYVSEETGREEVYVVTFPAVEGKWQVSTAGGGQPLWSPDGRSIFYIAPDGSLMRTRVRPGAGFAVDAPEKILETRIRGISRVPRQYDISPDGRRVLISSTLEQESISLTLVVNWRNALQKKASTLD